EMLGGDVRRKGIAESTLLWDRLLKSALSPEEQGKWQDEMKLRHERRDKACEAWLKPNLDQLEKAVRKAYERRLAQLISKAGLPAAKGETLKPAIAAAAAAQVTASRVFFETTFALQGEDFLSYLTKALTEPDKNALSFGTSTHAVKAGRQVFEAALHELLSAEELARIKTLDEETEKRVAKIARDTAERLLVMNHQSAMGWSEGRLHLLMSSANLGEERGKTLAEKLDAAGKTIDEKWTQSYVITAAVQIHHTMDSSADVDARLQSMEQGRWWFRDAKADAAATAARAMAWEETITAMLTPDEKTRWLEAERQEKEGRLLMAVHMAVSELDRVLLLLPDQRTSIEAMIMEAVKPLAAYQGDLVELWQQNLEGALILLPALDTGLVEKLLDETQKKSYAELLKRWQPFWGQLQTKLHNPS
ncbi:MAG: hypothetical protein JWO94_2219, partial [Verrucomicrobiaceae bacterium]|nr:hypothetical protein [Verrucomicrobiaceae bacterium]